MRLPDSKSSNSTGLELLFQALDSMVASPIAFCDSMSMAQTYPSPGTTFTYVLNSILCPPLSRIQLVQRDIRNLARKLRHDEPHTSGLLACKGFVTEATGNGPMLPLQVKLTMVFRAPPRVSGSPRSLRDMLVTTTKI